jgi:hypothetical protein
MDNGREDLAHPGHRPRRRGGDPGCRAVRAVAPHKRREVAPVRAAASIWEGTAARMQLLVPAPQQMKPPALTGPTRAATGPYSSYLISPSRVLNNGRIR